MSLLLTAPSAVYSLEQLGANSDLLQYVAGFIPASGLFNLRWVSKAWKGRASTLVKTNRILVKRVIAKLASYGHGQRFLDELYTNGGELRGEFVLHALEGGDWTPQGIDVYVRVFGWGNTNHSFCTYLSTIAERSVPETHGMRVLSTFTANRAKPVGSKRKATEGESAAREHQIFLTQVHVLAGSVYDRIHHDHAGAGWFEMDMLGTRFDGNKLNACPVNALRKRSTGCQVEGISMTKHDQYELISTWRKRGYSFDNVVDAEQYVSGIPFIVTSWRSTSGYIRLKNRMHARYLHLAINDPLSPIMIRARHGKKKPLRLLPFARAPREADADGYVDVARLYFIAHATVTSDLDPTAWSQCYDALVRRFGSFLYLM